MNAVISQIHAGILLPPGHLIFKSELFLPLFNKHVKRREMHGQIDKLVYRLADDFRALREYTKIAGIALHDQTFIRNAQRAAGNDIA